ncbi:MAG: hypothetical protein HOH19_06440 [Kordiimonadaceae bacterium]|jgi:hypothetical protein|nr:hypothetical protein [Kordiimonadaceae bacterium]
MIRLFVFSWLFFISIAGSVIGQEEDEPEMALLPQGEGREEVFYLCSACHSIKTVVQQRLSRDMWDKTLDYMVSDQGMPELETEERAQILNYLSTHVSIE